MLQLIITHMSENTSNQITTNCEYEEVQQIEEDDDYFLARRQIFTNPKKNLHWKGTFAQKIPSQNFLIQQPSQPTFSAKFVDVPLHNQNQRSESQFSDLNSSSSEESEKEEQKCTDSSGKTTGTFSLTCTENCEMVEKCREEMSEKSISFGFQLNKKEFLKLEKQIDVKIGDEPEDKEIQREIKPKYEPDTFDKSVYLKPGKSIYEVKIQNLGQHLFFKYKDKSIQVDHLTLNYIFQEFLNANILIPQLPLAEVPRRYWKGLCQLLVTYLNSKYMLKFKQILEHLNKNFTFNKNSTDINGFFQFSILKNSYSKSQLLINTVEQKIKCYELLGSENKYVIKEERKKVENLWFMVGFEKAEALCNDKIKSNMNKKVYKELKGTMMRDRDWWIINHFQVLEL